MASIPIGSRHIFVDESGDPSLETSKQGVTNYFVLSAVIVNSSDLAVQEEKVKAIIEKFFPMVN